MTLRPGIPPRREKGQPEGFAVTGRARKPWVVKPDLVSGDTTDHNNSNLTPDVAPAATGEWELLQGIVPITVFMPVLNTSIKRFTVNDSAKFHIFITSIH